MTFERDFMRALKRPRREPPSDLPPNRERFCFYCRMPVFPNTPCICERAQEEARRIRSSR